MTTMTRDMCFFKPKMSKFEMIFVEFRKKIALQAYKKWPNFA